MKKKYVLEFGKRGRSHTDNIVFSTELDARQVAANFVRCVGGIYDRGANSHDWYMTKGIYRKSWQGPEHFVAISLLDGVMRGPAATKLWRIDATVQGFKEESYDQITD